MNSPVIDTSALDDESGVIPDESLWEKGCEEIPKANDYKYGVNFMNQLINVSKLDHFLGSTIDDSMGSESLVNEGTPKTRIGSGDFKFKGKSKAPKNKELNSDISINAESSKASAAGGSNQKSKKGRPRYNSVTPHNQKSGIGQRVKSGNADQASKTSKYGNSKFDKNISTKATNITNSENEENMSTLGADGIRKSNDKFKNNHKLGKRGNSVLKNQTKILADPPMYKKKVENQLRNSQPVDLEEEKIVDDIQDSFGNTQGQSKKLSNLPTPSKDSNFGPIDPEVAKQHNKTETLLNNNSKKFKTDTAQKTPNQGDSISFEESLVTGVKIEAPKTKQNKNLQKKMQDVNSKKAKIDEIQQKYDKSRSKEPKQKDSKQKRMTRGYSYQEHDKLMKNKFNQNAEQKQEDPLADVGINASKITAKKRDTFKAKNDMGSQKLVFESKRKIEDEENDEKLRTQTFRFTNQFKSEYGNDQNYFNEEEDEIYDEFIEEEIDAESHHSPPKQVHKMRLVKDSGPQDVPSDTNPFTKARGSNDAVDMMGTPISKPPKVPPRVNMKNVFKSPANEIFKTKKVNSKTTHKDIPQLEKRNSEPPKPLNSIFKVIPTDSNPINEDGIMGYDISHDEETARESQTQQKSIAELTLQKMRSDYAKGTLAKRPYSPPFMNDH